MSFIMFLLWSYIVVIIAGVGHRYVETVKLRGDFSGTEWEGKFSLHWAIVESAKLPYYAYLALTK